MEEIKGQKKRFRSFIQKLVKENLQVKDPGSLANKLYLLFEVALMESQVFMEEWPIQEAKSMFRELVESAD